MRRSASRTSARTSPRSSLPRLAICHRPVCDVGSDLATNLDFSHSLGPPDGSFLALLLPRTEAWPRFDGRTDRQLSVVLVALFAFAFLGERPSATGWMGIRLSWHPALAS